MDREAQHPEMRECQMPYWFPETPLKPTLMEPQSICEDGQVNQLSQAWSDPERFLEGNQAGWSPSDRFSAKSLRTQTAGAGACSAPAHSIDPNRSLNSWGETLATKSQAHGDNSSIYMFSFGSTDRLTFGSLLALAEAANDTAPSANAAVDANVDVTSSSFYSVSSTENEDGNSGYGSPSFNLNLAPGIINTTATSMIIAPQFAPMTPEQNKGGGEKRVSNTPNPEVDEKTVQAREKQVNEVGTECVEAKELDHDKHQSCAAVVLNLQENHNLDKRGNQCTDLNKTPQERPRRKKHRPKVVIEDKPKKTHKPATPKPASHNKNPRPKRKYVRKNGLNKQAATLPAEINSGTTESKTTGGAAKSCKRSLNFDFEGQMGEESCAGVPSNFIPDWHTESIHIRVQTGSTVKIGHGIQLIEEKTNEGIGYDFAQCMNETSEHPSTSEKEAPMPSSPLETDLHDKLMAVKPSECTKGKCQIVFSDETHDKETSNAQMIVNTIAQSASRSPNYSNFSSSACWTKGKRTRGQKREHSCTTDKAELYSVIGSGAYYNAMQEYISTSTKNECNYNKTLEMHLPEIYKKKRTEKVHNSTTSSSSSTVTAAENSARQIMACSSVDGNQPMSETNCKISLTQLNGSSVVTKIAAVRDVEAKQHNFESKLAVDHKERLTRKRSKGSTRACNSASLIGIADYKQEPFPTGESAASDLLQGLEISPQPYTCMEALVSDTRATVATKKRTKRHSPTILVPAYMYKHNQHLTKSIGPPDLIRRVVPSVDAIVEQFKNLDINQEQYALVPYDVRYHEQNALALYQRDGLVVPFQPVRKRRPRPKVDLDDETNRVWKLLLENINSLGIDGTDEDKAKWWEAERRMFSGRADSFIARMHLVQGDRRFSQWKGSVVDSVVGVFLTQNVSDHLSSSAFMSLAARFPLKSKSSNGPSHIETTGALVKHPKVCILEPDEDNIQWHEENYYQPTSDRIRSNLHSNSYVKPTASSSFGGSTSYVELLRKAETSMLHGVYNLVSDNASSNGKDGYNQSEINTGDLEEQKKLKSDFPRATIPSPNYFLHLTSNSRVVAAGCFGMLGEENRVSNHSKRKEENCTCEQSVLSTVSTAQATVPKILCLSSQAPKFSSGHNQLCNNPQSELNKMPKSRRTVEDIRKMQACDSNCKMQQIPDIRNSSEEISEVSESTSIAGNLRMADQEVVESNSNDCGSLLDKTAGAVNASTSKIKRVRNGKQQDACDWESLRKQAQDCDKKRERTADTIDSLDWEAVRCADVGVIADTIKERGMNNLLAERIKEFLNRLVRDHGSIDLEWLRDVQPDKAKEYLLSIRGLGLKSVECVRLLTLHHLAFPVDTNVGRIAVRLGWVPLQPLPESLQLHLLELYPVLESIQKYLWPRLCKLDQRTLYELHYQMITFGKVFCTKSRPNCNACPMRGECRHFASAFASARLALPAPEEKSIVGATENKAADQNPEVVINPLQLQHSEASQIIEMQSDNRSHDPIIEVRPTLEPFIEEPATPEPEPTHIQESEIEDTFYEDPDEIPTIKLNIEEFTQNLQSYMQQNMELQEGHMSKALVALTPEVASIPMPKLKNVSRLRTEHQVYELPDSHPLLERLDKREPGDPCSYLLAIWTPGETADSNEIPEKRCSSQECGKLCDEKTCFSCNNIREMNSQIVRGTLLIPCRTAMRGSFPLNGTYFQVNEVFADHESSLNPIEVPRAWIWDLPRRTVYFGTSVTSIFKGVPMEVIQYCFWRGFVCVRGFDQKTRAPRPLIARLHFPASKLTRTKGNSDETRHL